MSDVSCQGYLTVPNFLYFYLGDDVCNFPDLNFICIDFNFISNFLLKV